MSRSRTQQGFTLLEVLIAMVIFAIAFGAIAGIFQTALRQSRTAETLLDAEALAEQQMARLGKDLPLTPGVFTGVAKSADPSPLAWRTEIGLAEPLRQDADVALYSITIEISDQAGDRTHLRLQTLRLGPAP